jgi:hypothetical protein
MTNINFPDNPSLNDTYLYGDVTFKFDGTHWYVLGASTLTLSQGKVLIGDADSKAVETDWSDKADTIHAHSISVEYADVNSKLKSKSTVTSTVNLSASGIGEITLAANTAFVFSNYELNKEYLLIITPNGFTPSFLTAARHIITEGSAEFDTTGIYYVSLRCIDATGSAEKLLTTIAIETA